MTLFILGGTKWTCHHDFDDDDFDLDDFYDDDFDDNDFD